MYTWLKLYWISIKKPLVIRTSAGLLLFTKEGGEGSDGFSLSVISVGSMEQ